MAGKEKSFSIQKQDFKNLKTTDDLPEREASTEKAPASDVFSGVLENKEKKTEN